MAEAMRDLIVLGAGPAGLAAAWRATLRGLSVTVLERAPALGGMAGSFRIDGIPVDHGSHRLHPATPAYLLDDLRRLLGDDLQTRRRNGRLRVYDRWIGFPLRPTELVRAVPPRAAARVARDAVRGPFARRRGDSYESVLTRSLGPELYRALYAPYAVKLWGLPGGEIDPEQARVRVTADTPWKVVARMLLRRGDGQGRVFHYPRNGFGQIVSALAEASKERGVDLRTAHDVTGLHDDGDGVIVRTDKGEHRARRVFSTLPLPVLARLVLPPAPDVALAAADALRFRAMLLVYVVHTGGRWTPYDAHYLPGLETPITRVSEPTNYRDSDTDPTDRTVLCVEIPCGLGDATWSADDETLTTLVIDGLAAAGLPPVVARVVEVRRLPRVYPMYERGFADRLAGLEAWVEAQPRITTFGRLGLFAHDNTHHAMAMAYAAVDCLGPDGGWDEGRWTAARASFRAHVVED